MKASMVERVIQTLKLMVRQTIRVNQNKTYIRAMKIIVDVYNTSPHRSLGGLSPKDMYEGKNKRILRDFQYKSHFEIPKLTKVVYRVGNRVCVALL